MKIKSLGDLVGGIAVITAGIIIGTMLWDGIDPIAGVIVGAAISFAGVGGIIVGLSDE